MYAYRMNACIHRDCVKAVVCLIPNTNVIVYAEEVEEAFKQLP